MTEAASDTADTADAAGSDTADSNGAADADGAATAATAHDTRYPLHLGLFALTCVATVWAGRLNFGSWEAGLGFGATLMTILVFHEMGHFVVARRHGIDASLPFFVPLPPQISLGTLGAVIRMDNPIQDRNQLLDVGAAGPLAGLVAAIPLLFVGLWLSPVVADPGGGMLEGNSLLYIAAKYVVTGRYLPGSDGADIVLHPIGFAAWVGLLITMINLIPIGQLDGGHIACAALGDRHERFSRRLHLALLAMAAGVWGVLALEARAAGLDAADCAAHGARGAIPWLVWALVLLVMRRMSGGVYHPPVGDVPLTKGRRTLVWVMAGIFLLLCTPAPLRPAL
jgi:membrane-associated protease RseP (regulator of RpoE activity)